MGINKMDNIVTVKKGVVKSIVELEPYEGNYGTLYKFTVTFENGDSGEYSAKVKEQEKFIVGKEVEYEVHINPQYPQYPKIKPHYEQKGFSGGGKGGYSDADKERMARSVAIKSSAIFNQARSTSKEDVIEDADFFLNYIKAMDKKVADPASAELPKAKVSMVDKKDLPF